MSDFEKLAIKMKSNNPVNPIFKDRNRDTKTKVLSDKNQKTYERNLKIMWKILNDVRTGQKQVKDTIILWNMTD